MQDSWLLPRKYGTLKLQANYLISYPRGIMPQTLAIETWGIFLQITDQEKITDKDATQLKALVQIQYQVQ